MPIFWRVCTFRQKFQKNCVKREYSSGNYIIVNENHKDESLHRHAYIKLDKKIRIRKETFFDIKLEDKTIYHPNIQEVRSSKAVIDYILKHDDYISKYKIDNLQIAQIIIEKEIKEGRYITNNKLAKEYPKTYTLYNKRLIDWKTKIEEQYYKFKSFGKPFVEFHYGNKMCRKSSYAENFDEKIAYWFDNKNWFDGYDKQPILIIDDFDSTQLYYYSTFLKILFGQQRRLEIKKKMIQSDQLDWCFDAIWNYKKSQDTFSERKYERNPYYKQQHRQYLDSIDYFQYFEKNWESVNNLDITKNIFHNNYSSIFFNNNYYDSEINNDNYLLIEKIRTILAKRTKSNQSDSKTSDINSQDLESTNKKKQKC
ncbi:Geminivirus Rep catalytic domain-containing protein [Gigaspora rosea]|uniref:Geminivirus Rep catalytic domain-containing protein n=1 Tax=Gigaspora rosea TaxID=44941 RepID=A0A397VW36_9GLOM|nr:Geminivirus Rep catalytic domain-containing protein [Gigaspora rosea]